MAKIVFALSATTGKPVHISELEHLRGKTTAERSRYEDAFICKDCKRRLIPVLGDIRENHFRHESDDDICESIRDPQAANESYLRQWIMEFIAEQKKIQAPLAQIPLWAINFGDDIPGHIRNKVISQYGACTFVGKNGFFAFQTVAIRQKHGACTPDLIAVTQKGEICCIEILSAPTIPENKLAHFRENNISAIAVDISSLSVEAIFDEEQIKQYIDQHVQWIYSPLAAKEVEVVRNALRNQMLQLIEEEREAARQLEIRRQEEARKQQEELRKQKKEDKAAAELEQQRRSIYCWACNEVKDIDEMVMYNTGNRRGLCRTCHYEKGVMPQWR